MVGRDEGVISVAPIQRNLSEIEVSKTGPSYRLDSSQVSAQLLVITHDGDAPVGRNVGASVEKKEAGSGSL